MHLCSSDLSGFMEISNALGDYGRWRMPPWLHSGLWNVGELAVVLLTENGPLPALTALELQGIAFLGSLDDV